ncbi:40S ribosomal protein S18 [Hordeum vulgare]|nr:40S ribosomal protein S18 [Hordeum vulgare]
MLITKTMHAFRNSYWILRHGRSVLIVSSLELEEMGVPVDSVKIRYSPFSRTTKTARVVTGVLGITFECPGCKVSEWFNPIRWNLVQMTTNRAGELSSEEMDQLMTVVANPRQFKVPDWFFNRKKDYKDGRFSQVLDKHVTSRATFKVKYEAKCEAMKRINKE